jgi:hypothetical protein
MRLTRSLTPAILLAVLALTACGGDAPPPDQVAANRAATRTLADAPLMTGSQMISSNVGQDAAQAVVTVPFGPDSVANWYRQDLVNKKWNIVGDAKMADGSVSLHASRNGTPLWIIIRGTGVASSQVTLVGAVPDSTADTTGGR